MNGKCPICGEYKVERYRPFCSKRCTNLDFGRWLGGYYRITTGEETDFKESPGQIPQNGEY